MSEFTGWRLVLRHRYRDCAGRDLSGHRNHGYRVLAEDPPPVDWSSFGEAAARVYVAPSKELSVDGGSLIHVGARSDRLSERNVIIEGYLSFSIYVQAGGVLAAGVMVSGVWLELASPPGAITPGEPFEVALLHSDAGRLQLILNGSSVACRRHGLGRPRGISWPYGLTVGAWPDADLRRFYGAIEHVAWWRTRPPDAPSGLYHAAARGGEDAPSEERVLDF